MMNPKMLIVGVARGFALAFVCAVALALNLMADGEVPVVDGRLDDACWKTATWHSDFKRKKYSTRTDPHRKTEFAMLCTDRCVYFAVRCHEPNMEAIRKRPDTTNWLSDCVELWLSPGDTEFEFYHFAASPNSKDLFAAFYSEGGNIQPDPYAPAWTKATALEDGAWTCEFGIPLSAFYMTRNDAWSTTWRVNVTREMREPQDEASWSLLEFRFKEPSSFNRLDGFARRPDADDICVREVVAEPRCRADGMIRGELAFSVYAGEEGDYEIAVSDGGMTAHRLARGWNKVRVPCAYRENGRHLTRFDVTRKGSDRTASRTFPVRVDFRPLRVTLTKPGFRDNFYPGQDASTVEGALKIAAGGSAELTLEGPGFPRRTATVRDGERFSFDTRGFADGEAFLTVRAGDETERVRIRKLAPTGHQMSWIENGHLVIDGKPVLRRTFSAYGYKRGKANMERFVSELDSFRMTTNFVNVNIEPARILKGVERREGIYDVKPSAELLAKIDERMDACRDRDITCWEIVDEPECRGISPVWLRHIYEYVAERDPYHVVTFDSRGGKAYIDCADFILAHPYLGASNTAKGRRYGVPPCEMGSYLDAYEAADRPDKCLGILPTCFAYRWTSIQNDYPTLEEYLCCAWAGIVRGAKGLKPYAGHDLGDRPALYDGTRYLFESCEALQDFILLGTRTTLTKSKETETTLFEYGGERLIVALNFTKDAKTATFPGVTGRFREFRGTRTFDLSASGSPVPLAPFETLLATTRPFDAGLKPKESEFARIAALEHERTHRDNQLLERYEDMTLESNMDANFGGGLYKLIDGALDMLARSSDAKTNSFITLNLKFTPRFRRLRVRGYGLDGMTVSVAKDGVRRTLPATTAARGKWMRELDFGETVEADSIRIDFNVPGTPGNCVEVYEIEIPNH